MQTYNIIIDELQRKAIVEALEKNPPFVTKEEAESDVNKFGLLYLLDMFRDLPKEEKEAPKVTHGFCL